MADLARQVEQARELVRHDWSDERIGLVLAAARRRRSTPLAAAAAGLFVASGAATATLVTLALRARRLRR
jgi:hypothetical protein